MTLGPAPRQGDLLDDVVRFCERRSISARSTSSCIASATGSSRTRPSPTSSWSGAPLRAAVGGGGGDVLQRLEGLSDREAVERFCFDNRWRYATGSGGYDTGSWTSFSHTVLVDMRERLRRSERPNRIFEVALGAARERGSSPAAGCSTPPRSTTRWRRWTPSR